MAICFEGLIKILEAVLAFLYSHSSFAHPFDGDEKVMNLMDSSSQVNYHCPIGLSLQVICI